MSGLCLFAVQQQVLGRRVKSSLDCSFSRSCSSLLFIYFFFPTLPDFQKKKKGGVLAEKGTLLQRVGDLSGTRAVVTMKKRESELLGQRGCLRWRELGEVLLQELPECSIARSRGLGWGAKAPEHPSPGHRRHRGLGEARSWCVRPQPKAINRRLYGAAGEMFLSMPLVSWPEDAAGRSGYHRITEW